MYQIWRRRWNIYRYELQEFDKPDFFEVIDYWCNKDIRGLIQMPFSRHWIMHTEACLRVKNKIHP